MVAFSRCAGGAGRFQWLVCRDRGRHLRGVKRSIGGEGI